MMYLDGPQSVCVFDQLKHQLERPLMEIVQECHELDTALDEMKPYLDEENYKMIVDVLEIMNLELKPAFESVKFLCQLVDRYQNMMFELHRR